MNVLTLPETAKLIRAELERRFPGCPFSIRSLAHSDAVAIRWIDGPTQAAVERAADAYVRPNLIGDALAGAGHITCTRLYSLPTVSSLVDQRARYYASAKPVVLALTTAGVAHADLAPFDAAGAPINPSDLRPWRYAMENHNAYTPPPATVQPAADSPAGKLAIVARFYVPSVNEGAIVACEVSQAPDGGHWIRISGAPSQDVRLALTGALYARWDRFRRVWTTRASFERIQAALPAA